MSCADAATGVRKRSFLTWNSGFVDPIVADGTVYVGCGNGRLYALDAANGTEKWNCQINTYFNAGAIHATFANGIVYCNSADKKVIAVEAGSGRVLWNYTTGGSVVNGACVVDYLTRSYHPGLSGEQQ